MVQMNQIIVECNFDGPHLSEGSPDMRNIGVKTRSEWELWKEEDTSTEVVRDVLCHCCFSVPDSFLPLYGLAKRRHILLSRSLRLNWPLLFSF
jgi:hypothetical protein